MEPRRSLHRLAVYLLPAGMLLCLLPGWFRDRAFADGEGQTASVVISEVMWMGSDLSTSDEWVEVACLATDDCDLSGWIFTSLKSTGEEAAIVRFATGAMIPPGDVRVISHYSVSSSRLLTEPWIATSSISLPNTKLLLRLRDATGNIRDEVDDGIGNPFAGANPSGGPKASMERIDLNASGNVSENWRTSITSSGFKEGSPIFGSPGELSLDRGREGPLSSSSSDSSISSISFHSSVSSDSSSQASLTSSASSQVEDLLLSSSFSSSFFSSSTSFISSSSSISFASSSASSRVEDPLLGNVGIFITEVLSNPVGADTGEWIEIGNLGADPVNIAGWILDDGNSSAVYHIPPRLGSGLVLSPGEYVSFRKSVTALPLDNSGESVSLKNGSQLIDAWEYPLTAEEVSFGRDPDPPYALHAFCVPSEGRRNSRESLAPRIVIQDAGNASIGSAFVQGTERVTLNLEAAVGAGSLASAVCAWDFGDDAVSTKCNPPSHTFSDPGDYSVRLTVRDFCGGISVAQLSVTVLPEEKEASSISFISSVSYSSSVSSLSSSSASSISSSTVLMSLMENVRIETGVVLSEVQTTADEWIELFNPTDRELSLVGWILDDLKEGGSKPWSIPLGTVLQPGEFKIFSGNQTKLKLNDSGDDVWLIAPDASWSEHVMIPKLKAGISFGICDGEWSISDPTPGQPNACATSVQSSVSSAVMTKKAQVKSGSSFPKTRYVMASSDSSVSLAHRSLGEGGSGSFVMSYALTDLPPTLTVAGPVAKKSAVLEVGALGALLGLSIALIWLGRKWWGL